MKTLNTIKALTIALLFSIAGSTIVAQGTLELRPYTGYNITLGEFSRFSSNGLDFGIAADYSISKNWGLGLDFNHQSNDFVNPFDFSTIPEPKIGAVPYRLINSSEGKWTANTFGFGPWWRYAIKDVSFEAYLKAGITMLKTPEASTVFEYDRSSRDLFRMDRQNSTAFGITTGLRLNYDFSKNISAFINPQYVYGANRVEYSKTDIDPAFALNSTSGEVEFRPGLLLEQRPTTYKFNPSYFNFNVGVTFRIGKPRSPGKPKGFGPIYPDRGRRKPASSKVSPSNNRDNENCLPPILSKSTNSRNYILDQKERPSFEWINNNKNYKKPEKYIFRLLNDKKEVVYTKETKKNKIAHSKVLESIYKEYATDKKKKMYWDVEAQFKDCGSQTSAVNSFSLKSSSGGLDIDLTNIECGSPAFNEDGTVNYTGQIVFTNSANNSNSITIPQQTFNLTDLNGNNSTNATQRACGQLNFIMMPITLAPGQSATYCMSFKRPFGETATAVHANYHQTNTPGLVMTEIDDETLPNCVCNVCEDDWVFQTSNIQTTGSRNNQTNSGIKTDFQILNSDLIQEVKAEIVSVKHEINDEDCYTCTKEDNQMALFSKNRGRITSSSDWENNGRGELYDENNDNYGNMFTWKAKSPGVDFSTPKKFNLFLNLPERSSLDCCNSKYTICVRYTFTNINCETCSYLVCYEIDTKDIPADSGPIVYPPDDQKK